MTRRTKIVLSLAAGSILLAGGVCGGCLSLVAVDVAELARVSDAFMDDLAAGRLEAAYASTAQAMKVVTTQEAFRAAYDFYPALRNQAGRETGRWRIRNGDQAEVLYRIPNPPNPVTMSVSLRKEQGQWRVQGFGIP